MTRCEIIHIVRSHYHTLTRYSAIIKKHFKPEDIHKFRVEYKKLRAFCRMISFNKPGRNKLKIEAKIKKSYSILGTIRDSQLQHLRLKKTSKEQNEGNNIYFTSLNNDIRKLKSKFTKNHFNCVCKKGVQKNITLIAGGFTKEEYEKYIDYQWTKIDSVISGNDFSDSNIHSIRKCIKDIYYNVQAIEKVGDFNTEFQSETVNNQLQYFDELLEDLGNFQDTCTAIDMLESRLVRSRNLQEQQFLIHHRTKLIAEKNAMKDLVIEKLLHHFTEYNLTLTDDASQTM
ncbi:MAG: CHAD domain-containing protein [Ginsengibacter sp.]